MRLAEVPPCTPLLLLLLPLLLPTLPVLMLSLLEMPLPRMPLLLLPSLLRLMNVLRTCPHFPWTCCTQLENWTGKRQSISEIAPSCSTSFSSTRRVFVMGTRTLD